MKFFDPIGKLRGITVVENDVVGYLQTCLSRRLCAHDCGHLLLCQIVALLNASELQRFGAIDHQDSIDQLVSFTFREQWYAKKAIIIVDGIDLRFYAGPYPWMQQKLQAVAPGFIGKDHALQVGAVQAPGSVQYVCAKGVDDFRQGCLAGFDDFPGDDVGVDHRAPVAPGEFIANGCFSGPYPTGYAYNISPH